MEAPMPFEAPVTTATFPFSFWGFILSISFLGSAWFGSTKMLLLFFGEGRQGRIRPAAAEGLDQLHAGNKALAHDARIFPLCGQSGAFAVHDFKITDQAGPVAK